MSERNTTVQKIGLGPEYDHWPCISKQTHEQVTSPKSVVKEELNYGPIHKLYSPIGTVNNARPTSTTLPIYKEPNTTSSFQGTLIIAPHSNIETAFRINNMISSSCENMSDERTIVRSRPINSEFLSVKNKDEYPILDDRENNVVKDIESLSLENFDEENNRTRLLFESNRLLPDLSGKFTNCISSLGSRKLCH